MNIYLDLMNISIENYLNTMILYFDDKINIYLISDKYSFFYYSHEFI